MDPEIIRHIQHALGAFSVTFTGLLFVWVLLRHHLYKPATLGIAFIIFIYQAIHVFLHIHEFAPALGHMAFDYAFAMGAAFWNALCYKARDL